MRTEKGCTLPLSCEVPVERRLSLPEKRNIVLEGLMKYEGKISADDLVS